MDLDTAWRLARFTAYLCVAVFGLCGGAYLWLSSIHPEFALNAIGDIGLAAAADYVRIYYLPT